MSLWADQVDQGQDIFSLCLLAFPPGTVAVVLVTVLAE